MANPVFTAVEALEKAESKPSFVSRRDNGTLAHWCPERIAGDYAQRCRNGRRLGEEAVDYITKSGDAAFLGAVVSAIVERGEIGPIETGFFTEISVSLIRSA